MHVIGIMLLRSISVHGNGIVLSRSISATHGIGIMSIAQISATHGIVLSRGISAIHHQTCPGDKRCVVAGKE